MCGRALRLTVVGIVVMLSGVAAQSPVTPTNDAPNPDQTIEGWVKMPDGRARGD